jgi:hypothetical protein
MNARRQAAFVSLEAIDAALCTAFLLCGLNLIGQLFMHLPLCVVQCLTPRGVESPLVQHALVGFVVTLIVGLVIVVALLRRELREDTA